MAMRYARTPKGRCGKIVNDEAFLLLSNKISKWEFDDDDFDDEDSDDEDSDDEE